MNVAPYDECGLKDVFSTAYTLHVPFADVWIEMTCMMASRTANQSRHRGRVD